MIVKSGYFTDNGNWKATGKLHISDRLAITYCGARVRAEWRIEQPRYVKDVGPSRRCRRCFG